MPHLRNMPQGFFLLCQAVGKKSHIFEKWHKKSQPGNPALRHPNEGVCAWGGGGVVLGSILVGRSHCGRKKWTTQSTFFRGSKSFVTTPFIISFSYVLWHAALCHPVLTQLMIERCMRRRPRRKMWLVLMVMFLATTFMFLAILLRVFAFPKQPRHLVQLFLRSGIGSKSGPFAHRGGRPENTLAAMTKSHQLGAMGVEVDLAFSKDGHPVLIHDSTVDRTSDGKGRVKDMTLAQLKKLDFGSKTGGYVVHKSACREDLGLLHTGKAPKGKGRSGESDQIFVKSARSIRGLSVVNFIHC